MSYTLLKNSTIPLATSSLSPLSLKTSQNSKLDRNLRPKLHPLSEPLVLSKILNYIKELSASLNPNVYDLDLVTLDKKNKKITLSIFFKFLIGGCKAYVL